jgi:Na+/H+ antiporter NhaB
VIAKRLDWDFVDFLVTMAPVSAIVWPVGMVTCVALETIQVTDTHPVGGSGGDSAAAAAPRS